MPKLLLGRTPDDTKTEVTGATDDLVTHGVIVGMTGARKTGLEVGLIGECLNAGVPTLLIDPKGGLTNLALVFPGLSGPEFEPWVDPSQAKAAGQSTSDFAAAQATLSRDGLAPWGTTEPQLAEFKAKFEVAPYTPGSPAGKVANKTYLTTLLRGGTDHPVATESLEVQHTPDSKVYRRVDTTTEQLTARCGPATAEQANKAVAVLSKRHEAKLRSPDTKRTTASSQVQQAEAARSSNMMEPTVSVFGGLFGGRKSASSLGTAARRHQAASNRVATAQGKLDELRVQRQDIDNELADEIVDIAAAVDGKAANIEPVAVELEKANVRITDLRLVPVTVA